MSAVRYWGVVPAAGLGRRMGGETPKQYLELAGKPVISHTLGRMLGWDFLQGLVVALHADDRWWSQQAVATDARVHSVPGGEHRGDSVLAALDALHQMAAPQDWVLVHDAARPCIRSEDVANLRSCLHQDPVGGLLALPVAETVKRGDSGERVVATLERNELWLAQTPQMFRYGQLRECLRSALDRGQQVTDEAAAIEAAGLQPRLVKGSRSNIKITVPADLTEAGFWLGQE